MHKHSRLQKKNILEKGMVYVQTYIYTCSTFCMHSSYKPIRNIKFVYVLFTANSIKQQDYGQIGKDDSTAVIKNYIVE